MFHRLYCSSGNTVGVDELLAFYEIDDSGQFVRSLAIDASGVASRYTIAHDGDEFGALRKANGTRPRRAKPSTAR